MLVEDIFVTTVGVDFLNIDNQKVKDYCLSLKATTKSAQKSNRGGWQSESLSPETPELAELVGAVEHSVENLRSVYRFKKDRPLTVSNCWINVNGFGDFNSLHAHRNWTFSCVYYVDTDENCGDLVLVHPSMNQPYHYMDDPFEVQTTQRSHNQVHYTPQTGKLVIMPSWILHLVEPNKSGKDRISIAFDIA